MPDFTPHHRLSVCKRLGAISLRVHLALTADWTLLYGPSGSGKSTLLRAACGLLPPGGVCFERTLPDGTSLPLENTVRRTSSHLRGVRWAPQRAALLPHLTVRQNVAFGASVAREAEPDRDRINQAIELFRLQPLIDRLPRDLSGGERQRANLARAFSAPGCRLLLLDEPFAGLDRTLRDELLPQMRIWLQKRRIPTLSVSHDVEEALQLQAHVVMIRDGQIEHQGPAHELLAAERARILHNLTNSIL